MNPVELQELVSRRFDEYVEALREMVGVDCGTYSPDGVNRIAELCEKRFRDGGWEVERIPHRPDRGQKALGDIVVGTLAGRGGPRVLLIGHMDTVFPDGTASARPFRVEGDRAFGPGVIDMKSGLLAGFFAVAALQDAGFTSFGEVRYICNPDEEIGSPFSKAHIRRLAEESDVCFVLEGARENGDIVSARKGTSDFVIDIAGRAAHAGVHPERGRSAIVEAAHKVLELQALNGRWPGVTVNPGVISGGTRPNVVPDRCTLEVDLRGSDDASFDQAGEEIRRIAEGATGQDVTATVKALEAHRPMEKLPATAELVTLAQEVARGLGFEVEDTATGGASDANTTAAAGVPTLDGLGPVGGDPHSPAEWLDLSSVVPRVSMLAGLLSRVGGQIGTRP